MPTITVAQAAAYAQHAGFDARGTAIIVAIAQAESGLNTNAINTNTDGSVDRGVLQINNRFHPEVSDSCAFNPDCAFQAGYTISKKGTNFSPWVTYQTGAYLKYTNVTPTISVSTGGTPWYEYGYGLLFGQGDAGIGGEHGTDFDTPADTPITALLSGTVTDISAPSWGKQITWRLDTPYNGIPYAYQIHLDAINPVLSVGSHINKGDLIGWSGGENSLSQLGGAHNPTGTHFVDSSFMSSGPHTEFGFSYGPAYGSGAGFANIGQHPELNPIGFLNAVRSGAYPEPQGITQPQGGGGTLNFQTSTAPSIFSTAPIALTGANDAFLQLSDNIHASLQHAQGFYGIAVALDESEQFVGIYNAFSGDYNPADWGGDAAMSIIGTITGNLIPLAIRAIIVIIGLVIIFGAIHNAAEPFYGLAATLGSSAAGEAALAA